MSLGIFKTRRFACPPLEVFEAWIDVSARVPPIVDMQADVRVGGAVQIVIEAGGSRSYMDGCYEAVEWGRRLQYTWQWRHLPETTRVAVEFRSAPGGCQLALTHEGFASAGSRQAHDLGWEAFLRQLPENLTRRTRAASAGEVGEHVGQ